MRPAQIGIVKNPMQSLERPNLLLSMRPTWTWGERQGVVGWELRLVLVIHFARVR